jgi:CRISPR-associated endonuclease Csn1
MPNMRYRLALDLGSTSLGWAMVRLQQDLPVAVIKAGVRIFSDGRNPKDGSSLAVTRREARAMRRRRDRLLKRKTRMTRTLVQHGFFPADGMKRKALELLDPYALRAKGLDEALKPEEFARALFHINQRRGFKSNRKTDKKDNDSGALKSAIRQLHATLDPAGKDGKPRTVGEYLHRRNQSGQTVRARYRQQRVEKEDGKIRIDKSYDLYVDRAMIEAEFDALWAKQAVLNPARFDETARSELKDCLLYQRPLKPVKPGRCTLMPEKERAPLALPCQQRFRIYQEVNNLRILLDGLKEEALTLAQRNVLATELDAKSKLSFAQVKKLLGFGGMVKFNLEDPKRQELKGNTTGAILARKEFFGPAWHTFDEGRQDAIVMQLLSEENESRLVRWLQEDTGVDEAVAESLAGVALPEGYGGLSAEALARILPELRRDVTTYDKAVLAAGFEHHSHISHAVTGEILPALPYYGEYLQRHVGFGTGKPEDSPEKRFGKIANPTVHIGLNQVRTVVNALCQRYGHPSEIIVEVARDLKQNQEQRKEDHERQARNQKRNERLRAEAAALLQCSPERVRHADIQKLILWEELSFDPSDRRCPYSGVQISASMVLSDQVEVEHILPFSQTLDDSLNNKTVSMRRANRIKGNRSPWDARHDLTAQGWDYQGILTRAEKMQKNKRYRFGEDGLQRWLREDKDFLARALNDTRYLCRVAREYLSLICPQNTRVIPGQMTALLRAKFGLNDILGLNGEKNRNDHRHHAVDACVIAVTDQGMLQRFAQASASARERQINRLVDDMPMPWPSYREHVARAVNHIWISHKPDHSHEGAMHNATAYALLGGGMVSVRKTVDGVRQRDVGALKVIEFADATATTRHGQLPNGQPRPYKGYKGDSNYCIEFVRNEKGKWEGEVISTFEAYQLARLHGADRLRHLTLSIHGKPLALRLVMGDYLRAEFRGELRLLSVKKIKANGGIFVAEHRESNVRQREDAKDATLIYGSFTAGSLFKAQGRRVTISPIGELRDPGFRG